MAATNLGAIQEKCKRMRELSRSEPAPSYEVRMQRLTALEQMVLKNQDRIVSAIDTDFGGDAGGRGKAYCTLGDIWAGLNTVREVKAHLHEWMPVEEVEVGFTRFPMNVLGKSRIYTKPLGVVLVLTPWNYPFHIPISALGDIIGAGNRAVVKPSEATPRTSALLQELISTTFDPDVVEVFTGGPEVASTLSAFPFDHILLVGSGEIGKKVLAAAAPNLTKVTLELGGKNPLFVCPDYDLKEAAETIATENLENGGQVCTGADTVFVPPGAAAKFVEHMQELYKMRWGKQQLAANPQYASCVNDRHFSRVQELIMDAKKCGAQVVSLDPTNCSEYGTGDNRVPPHAIINPADTSRISHEEIFGPLLVVREMSLTDAVSYVNSRPEPLACYVFTNDQSTKEKMAQQVRCGGMTINQVNKHTIVGPLPFGGVGASGMGCYHGVEGFRNFSHRMSVMDFGPVGLLGQVWNKVGPNISLPYSDQDVKAIQSFLDPLPPLDKIVRVLRYAVIVGALTIALRTRRLSQALLPVARWCVQVLERRSKL